MKIFLIIFLGILTSNNSVGQPTDTAYLNTDSNFNVLLNSRINKIIDWEKYTELGIADVTFVRFGVKNKNIHTLQFTGNPPEIIRKTFIEAIQNTSYLWKETDDIFLLPIVYMFEKYGQQPKYTNSTVFVHFLKEIYEDKKPGFPGGRTYEPFRCVILNPYYIHAYIHKY